MSDLILPGGWKAFRDSIPPTPMLIDYLVASGMQTFAHGAGGCGKSAFWWGALQALWNGEDYFGLHTKQTRSLLVTVDMNKFGLKERWGEVFDPLFGVYIMPKCNIAKPAFRESKEHKEIRQAIDKLGVELVCFDAVAGCMVGDSVREDETATTFNAALEDWLPGVAKVIIAHDNKRKRDSSGHRLDPDLEDYQGTACWVNHAAIQLHFYKVGNHHSQMEYGKSQVCDALPYKLDMYIDIEGKAEPWNEKRAQDVIVKTNTALRGLGPGFSETQKVAHLMDTYKISERTAWRWLGLTKA